MLVGLNYGNYTPPLGGHNFIINMSVIVRCSLLLVVCSHRFYCTYKMPKVKPWSQWTWSQWNWSQWTWSQWTANKYSVLGLKIHIYYKTCFKTRWKSICFMSNWCIKKNLIVVYTIISYFLFHIDLYVHKLISLFTLETRSYFYNSLMA